jgi:hypothetical protein
MMFAMLGGEARGFLAGAVGVKLDGSLGLVATQTLMFLFADIEGSAAMVRLRDAGAAGAGLQDLGLHWLRDGGRAKRIFQLQAGACRQPSAAAVAGGPDAAD